MGVGKSVLFFVVQFAAFVVHAGYFFMFTVNTKSHQLMRSIGFLFCLAPHIVLLKFLLPRSCHLWWSALQNVAAVCFGFVATMTAFRRSSNLMLLLVIIPILRFILGTVTRLNVEKLMLDAHVDDVVPVRRGYAWCFLLVIQILFATLSPILVTKVQDWGSYLLFLTCTMAQEILMRVTIPRQDKIMSRVATTMRIPLRSPHSRRSSVVSPVTSHASSRTTADGDSRAKSKEEDVQKEWYAVVLVGETISEYVGIFVNLALLLMFSDAILLMPLPAFSLEERPFDDPMPISKWILSTLLQMMTEIATDAICFAFEDRWFEFPVRKFWNAKSMTTRFVNLMLGALCGISMALSTLFFGLAMFQRQPYECSSINLCSCAPFPDNLYGMYCMRLYPATNGVPPP